MRAAPLRFESVTLQEGGPAATLNLLWCPGTAARHPVILMLGALDSNAPPAWSTNLIQEGYEGFAHNLPPDVVRDYAERWFRLYLHPVDPPPGPPAPIHSLAEAARQTQINAAPHASVVGAAAETAPEKPVAIGSRLELFTDDLLMGRLDGCSLKLQEKPRALVGVDLLLHGKFLQRHCFVRFPEKNCP